MKILRTFLVLLFSTLTATAQRAVTHEGRPAVALENDRIEFQILTTGGAFANFILKDDPKKMSPLWDPARMSREIGKPQKPGPGTGHFLCVDGFGPTTKEEQAAGYSFHGEANKLSWETVEGSATSITQRVRLPIVQEKYQRKVSLAPGEQVVLVESELESELSFDRPILWAEHGTVGAPFLKIGKVVVDQSTIQCQTKPYKGEQAPRTFASGQNFTWPKLGKLDLRVTPAKDGVMNHIGCLMDPKREHEFITAYNTEEKLMIGYLFRRQDYAWVQHWMNYPANGMYAWGVEFGMQPYDMTKQDILALTPMFGTPTFRWLPAKSKIGTRFLMFLTKVPDGFHKVDDVRLEGGQLIIEDRRAKKTITLKASQGL